jgi:carbonic anhydrase
MRRFIALPILLTAFAVLAADDSQCPPRYAYCGYAAPSQWANLPIEKNECGGDRQSPVNISTWTTQRGGPEITVRYSNTTFTIANTGHDIMVTPATGGNSITISGKTYDLVQFHFHTPSEHHVHGTSFPVELHLVHQLRGGSELAVIGVLIPVDRANAVLSPIFARLPAKVCSSGGALPLSLSSLLPKTIDSYYTYSGSLTTPPCSQIVTWYVANGTGITMTREQLVKLRALGDNARPVQTLGSNRKITLVEPK